MQLPALHRGIEPPGENRPVRGLKRCIRFSQFVELHVELKKRHGVEMQRCGATMPSKLRFPSPLHVEGSQRMGPLDAYLSQLMSSAVISRSQELFYFVGGGQPERRALWEAAVSSPPPSAP